MKVVWNCGSYKLLIAVDVFGVIWYTCTCNMVYKYKERSWLKTYMWTPNSLSVEDQHKLMDMYPALKQYTQQQACCNCSFHHWLQSKSTILCLRTRWTKCIQAFMLCQKCILNGKVYGWWHVFFKMAAMKILHWLYSFNNCILGWIMI